MLSVTYYQVSLCLVRLVITLRTPLHLLARFVRQALIVLLNLLVQVHNNKQRLRLIRQLTNKPLTMQLHVQLATDAHQHL